MVTEDATEHAHLVLNQVVDGGLTYAAPIFLVCLWLFLQGAQRLPVTIGLAGMFVGYGAADQFYPSVAEFGYDINAEQFRWVVAFLVAGVSITVAQVAIRFLAAGLVFLAVTRLISAGDRFGVDLEGDAFLSGLLTLFAIIASFSFRRLLPVLVSGIMASIGMIFAVYVALGWDIARLNGTDAFDVYLAVPLGCVSAYLQYKVFVKKRKEDMYEDDDDDDGDGFAY